MEVALLVFLILLNGFFAMSEIALVTARRVRLGQLAEAGHRGAERAIALARTPTRFLSTIQIGITSIGILSGIVGEAALAEPLADWLGTLGVPPRGAELGGTALVVVLITYFAIVVGELVPKRLGQISPERIASWVARPMLVLALAARPFVRLLSASTELLLRIIRVRDTSAQAVTEEEIRAVLDEGSVAGVLERQEHEIMRNAFRLDERQVSSLMTPRAQVVVVDVEDSLERNLERVRESGHSRFPVVRGDFNEILGIVTAKQMLAQLTKGRALDFSKGLRPAVFVPETLTGMELLETFRTSRMQFVLVVDEYGEVHGIVTVQDVLEAITGEFQPAEGEEAWAIARDDGSWLLDGLIPVPELKDCLVLKELPEEKEGRYHTLSGMLLLLLGRLPHTGDRVEWQDWKFEIVDMDGKRIDKVLASRR